MADHDLTPEPNFFRRGSVYRDALEDVDIRIAVSGIRGKSSTVQRLHDVFHERGYDTFAKITGDRPYTLHNGEETDIQRSGAEVTLYENRRLITEATRQLAATDLSGDTVAIYENHAITEYTMRLFNETFFRPHVIVIPNIRTDHTDTLGRTRQDIARSFARSIPAGTHVICGESNDAIYEYFAAELRPRDVTLSRITVPTAHQDLPGAESVYGIDDVLAAVDEPPLPDGRVDAMLETLAPEWSTLDGGSRVFHAAKVNEPESTELYRRLLAGTGADAEVICPFVFLRGDRRGRTASFAEYMDDLYDRGCIDRVHVAGRNSRTFARRVDPPTTVHDIEREDPAAILDAVLAEGQPVITMANTVHPFMRAFVEELNVRIGSHADTVADTDPARPGATGPTPAAPDEGPGAPVDAGESGQPRDAPEATFEVYEDSAAEWRWRLVHTNGNIIADSTRSHPSGEAAETALERVMSLAPETPVLAVEDPSDEAGAAEGASGAGFELYTDAAGEYRWRLVDDADTIVADSGEGYTTKANARKGIESVQRTAPGAAVDLEA